MRALSITQPWATLVAIGEKQIETRSWRTHYRGRIAIHASLGYPLAARAFAAALTDRRVLDGLDQPRGVVLGTAELYDVLPVEALRDQVTVAERAYGDYSDGRWGWLLRDVERFEMPIPAKGMLGLWRWDPGDETTSIRPDRCRLVDAKA